MTRAPVRRQVVGLAAVAAAVVGVLGGVAAGSRDDDPAPGAAPGTDGPGPTAGSTTGPTGDAPEAPVLWADQAALHDGDTTVPLGLLGPPSSVRRIAGGWLVQQEVLDLGDYQVSVVRPGREPDFLAETLGPGDVSDDGTRYVAGTVDGYLVWDLETREVVASVRGGRSPEQVVWGDAQFVDDATVATTWIDPDDPVEAPEVLVGPIGPGRPRLLVADVVGDWGISPDGRWYVGSSARRTEDGDVVPGCVVVRPVAGGRAGEPDCSGTIEGVPSFAPDSSAVLVDPGGRTTDLPDGFRLLPLGDAPDRGVVSAPAAALRAAFVDDERIAVVPTREVLDAPAVVLVCSVAVPCQEVGRSEGSPGAVVVGS